MNKINNAIVKASDASAVKEALISVFNDIDDRAQNILIEKILGVYSEPNISTKSTIKPEAVFLSYNVLSDMVSYQYAETITRYFENQEAADKYTSNGSWNYSNSAQSESGEYRIAAEFKHQRFGSCSLAIWNKHGKEE